MRPVFIKLHGSFFGVFLVKLLSDFGTVFFVWFLVGITLLFCAYFLYILYAIFNVFCSFLGVCLLGFPIYIQWVSAVGYRLIARIWGQNLGFLGIHGRRGEEGGGRKHGMRGRRGEEGWMLNRGNHGKDGCIMIYCQTVTEATPQQYPPSLNSPKSAGQYKVTLLIF